MKTIFIVNPVSEHGSAKKAMNRIENYCTQHQVDYKVYYTEYAGHGKDIASVYNKSDDAQIIVCGGDGTLHEVIQGLNDDVPIGLIPLGTGNDFYKSVSKRHGSIESILQATLNGEVRKIDRIHINHGDDYAINNLSFGLDAYVNWYVCTHMKKTKFPKTWYYPLAAVHAIQQYKSFNCKIKMDGIVLPHSQCMLCFAGKGNYYGDGFNPTPNGRLDDGFLHLCVADELSILQMAKLFPQYSKGTHLQHPNIHLYSCKTLEISFDQDIVAHADGEPFYCNEIYLSVQEKKISWIFPLGEDSE